MPEDSTTSAFLLVNKDFLLLSEANGSCRRNVIALAKGDGGFQLRVSLSAESALMNSVPWRKENR